MSALTDNDLADVFLDSDWGDAYRTFGRNQPRLLLVNIRGLLKTFMWMEQADELEMEKTAQRVASIIRSRNGKKAAVTRKKNQAIATKAAADKKEEAKQLKLLAPTLPGFE